MLLGERVFFFKNSRQRSYEKETEKAVNADRLELMDNGTKISEGSVNAFQRLNKVLNEWTLSLETKKSLLN